MLKNDFFLDLPNIRVSQTTWLASIALKWENVETSKTVPPYFEPK